MLELAHARNYWMAVFALEDQRDFDAMKLLQRMAPEAEGTHGAAARWSVRALRREPFLSPPSRAKILQALTSQKV